MSKKSNLDDNLWRILGIFFIFCWCINLFYNYKQNTLNHVLIPSIISTFLCIWVIIKPRTLWVFGLLSIFWGGIYVWSTGNAVGAVLFFVGIAIFIKVGFFKKFLWIKVVVFVAGFGYALFNVYRKNSHLLIDLILDSILVVIIVAMMSLLYHDDVRQYYKSKKKSSIGSLKDIFSEQEMNYIKLLIKDYKYFSVAQSLNVSESSVKRTFSKMYGKLDVKGKIEFLEEVKSLATPEEKEFLNLDDFFDNP